MRYRGAGAILGGDRAGVTLGRIRISYASARPLGAAATPEFTAVYLHETRSVRIVFAEPLAGGQTVKVELLDGILAENGLPVQPLAYTFATAR